MENQDKEEGLNMLTVFGKCLRRLRLDQNELLKEMAQRMSVTPAYLSAVENGKRKPTKELVNKILSEYDLDETQIQNIYDSYSITMEEVTINMSGANQDQSELGLVFARKINLLSEEQIKEIKTILKDN